MKKTCLDCKDKKIITIKKSKNILLYKCSKCGSKFKITFDEIDGYNHSIRERIYE
jgi:transcription elongation factor Elf1